MKVGKHWILFAAILILLLAAAATAAVAAANRALLQVRQAAAAAEAKAMAARYRVGPAAQLQLPAATAGNGLQQDIQQPQQTRQVIQIEAEQDPILYTDDGAYYGGDWWDWWWPLNPTQWGGGGYYSGPFYGKRWGGGQGKWNWQGWADGRETPQIRPGPAIGGE